MTEQKAKQVLIFMSDELICAPLQAALATFGCGVVFVSDKSNFDYQLGQIRPDMAIIDIAASNEGFVILEELRNSQDLWKKELPVMIGSQSGDLVEISRGLRLGIKDYFVKATFDPMLVAEKVKKQFGVITEISRANDITTERLEHTKILIVEDDKFLRDLAAQKLTKEHLQVLTAVDGEQGLAMAEKEIPDIILLDILLPGIDGYEVLRRVRANPMLTYTYIAMLSNFGQREDIQRALSEGADQFLVKANFTLDEVVEEVKKVISGPRVKH